MNFWKKLFAGMGFVCGFLVFETMLLAYHNSRRRHKNRKGRCRHNSFWDTLTRYMIFAWIYDGVKKSREQVGRRCYRRTGNEFRTSYDSGTRSNPSEPAKAALKTADAAQPKKQRSPPSAPLCGTGRRKALWLLQRGPLQHRKRTNDRGAVSGQAGTSRFKDLVLK